MNDSISRAAAIDVVRKCPIKEVTPAYMLINKAEVMTELMMLPPVEPETCAYWDRESNFCALHRPSAQPKRSKGKWIDEGQHADFFPHHAYRCSECGHHLLEIVVIYDFCPFCGADMRGNVNRDEVD